MKAHLDEYLSGVTFHPLMVTELSTKTRDFPNVNSCFKGSKPNLAVMKSGIGASTQNRP